MALPASSSCSCRGSPKDALTCLASFLVLSSPGTVHSSIHQLGVLHFSAFQGTHSAKSKMVVSGGIFLPSSSDVSGDPHRKEATAGFSSSSSPKLKSPPSDPSLPDGMSGSADWLGAGLSTKLTWQHIFFHPSPSDLQCNPGSSISPLTVDVSSFCSAFLFLPPKPLHGRQHLLVHFVHPGETSIHRDFSFPAGPSTLGWVGISRARLSLGFRSLFPSLWLVWDSQPTPLVHNCLVFLVENQANDGVYTPPGRSLIVLPCWSLAPTSSTAGMPASGLSWGMCCQWPRQTICSTSFHPSEMQHGRTFLCNITRR